MSKETEAEKLARMVREDTCGWDAAQIKLFVARDVMIAYVPSQLFKIQVVMFVRNRTVTYLRACFGDSTKTSPEDHVLRLINDNHDMAQKLVRAGSELTYYKSDNDKRPMKLAVRRLSGSDFPESRTYTPERDKDGVITGFIYNR